MQWPTRFCQGLLGGVGLVFGCDGAVTWVLCAPGLGLGMLTQPLGHERCMLP